MSAAPISVVIPTWRRPARLAFALEALAAQTLSRDRFSVLVVHDPDDEATGRVLAAARRLGFRLETVKRGSGWGPAAARNAGWCAAEGEWIAFTDDDCRPAPDWLEVLLRAAPEGEAFLQGRTEPDPEEIHLLSGLAHSQRIAGPSDWHETCNIAYRRSLLERLGGFDESWPFGAEDTDLGLRALAAGAERRYVADALVWHAVHVPKLRAALAAAGGWDFAARLVRRHPRQRSALHWGLFLKDSHAALAVAGTGVCAAAAARRPAPAAFGAIPYLWLRLLRSVVTHGRGPRALAAFCLGLPAQALRDAVEVGSTVRGAVRERVPIV